MVNWFTFKDNNSAVFIFASLLNGGQLLKERICSCGSKFFPLREDPIFAGHYHPGTQIGSHKSCFPLQNGRKHEDETIHLKLVVLLSSLTLPKILKVAVVMKHRRHSYKV